MADPALRQDDMLFGVQNSATRRFWTLASVDEALVRRLQPSVGGSDLLARLLATRDVTPEEAVAYLSPTLRETFPDE